MDKLIMYEKEEYGKDYIVLEVFLDNFDLVPVFLRTSIEEVKNHQKYVKVIKICDHITETEYFEHSVRSNKKGPAFIDKNGKKYFYDKGIEIEDSESLVNKDRSDKLREILKEEV